MTTRNRWKSDGTNANFGDAGRVGGCKRAKVNNRSWFQNLTLQINIVPIPSRKPKKKSRVSYPLLLPRASDCDQIVRVLLLQHKTHNLFGWWEGG